MHFRSPGSTALACLLAFSSHAVLASGPYVPPSAQKPAGILTEEQTKKALEMLTSPSAATRARARDALRLRTEELETVQGLLQKAADFHKARLNEAAQKKLPSLKPFEIALQAWQTKREEAYKNIMTDWHKNSAKLSMIETQYGETERLLLATEQQMKGVEAAWQPLLDATGPLEEIENELANIEPTGKRPPKSGMTHLEQNLTADKLAAYNLYTERVKARSLRDKVNAENAACSWANAQQKAFALTLNTRRYYLGLQPLRLDERLSQAATDHSKEMKALGYFAHESPVEKNKTPWVRAQNAKFEGSASGENIFTGSASSEVAFTAWWNSDGHRLIMFTKGINTAGVGPVAETWTFMSGNKKWK